MAEAVAVGFLFLVITVFFCLSGYVLMRNWQGIAVGLVLSLLMIGEILAMMQS